jgi:hypothetical protein
MTTCKFLFGFKGRKDEIGFESNECKSREPDLEERKKNFTFCANLL